jgi:hypothetical protein
MSVLIDRPASELTNLAIEGQHYGFGDNSAIIPPLADRSRTMALQKLRHLRHFGRNPPRASSRVSSLAVDRHV